MLLILWSDNKNSLFHGNRQVSFPIFHRRFSFCNTLKSSCNKDSNVTASVSIDTLPQIKSFFERFLLTIVSIFIGDYTYFMYFCDRNQNQQNTANFHNNFGDFIKSAAWFEFWS